MKRSLLFLVCILASMAIQAQEYFPKGTKWTEIRLDTLKYDCWYSKVGDEWVPNFETIEYYVKGEFIDKDRGDGKDKFRCVYTNGPEWTDSLALMIQEEGDAEYVEQNSVMVSVQAQLFDGKSYLLSPGMAYQFDWSVGKDIHYLDICSSNLTGWFSNPETFGTIEEIKEGKFGGEIPLKYVDLNGVRIIQGIGVTEWNDGECLFGPTKPYSALSTYEDYRWELYPERHYRSMLVHFERNGEVLYDVWPEKPQNDYIPFVELGKQWHVVRSDFDAGCHIEHYMLNGEVVKDGKTYLKMYRSEDILTVVYDTGLFREDDHKVYTFDTETQKEYLIFDYSLKKGDTYETYSYDEEKVVTYKVLSVSDYLEGPKAICYDYDQAAGSKIERHRYLRKWIVCRTDDNSIQKTWIEGVGSVEGPLGNLHDVVLPGSSKDYLAYVEYKDNIYLPFSFYDTMNRLVRGCNLPTGAENNEENDGQHRLAYELEGDRLHVYGEVFTQCGSNNYAYFYEKSTEDPLVQKIEFIIQEVGPTMDCMTLHATNFYVPGFDPNINYIVVDNQGEEHPVINKTPQMVYRPFVEDDKVWKVGDVTSGNPVQLVDYYFFDGDTIINGKTCKQMMRKQYVSPEHPNYDFLSQEPSLIYVGAWYEEDKKVYEYDTTDKQFKLMFDFSLEDNGTFQINDLPYVYVVGPRKTGGIKGFKGVYRDVWEWADGESYKCAPWMEGVGIIYAPPTSNICNVELADPQWFLMECYVGDEVIYFIEGCEDGATPESAGARKQRFDFTHTTKIEPKTRTRSEAELSLYGEYSEQQLSIHLDPIDDAYLVSITDESGKVAYEKSINAGNIVGLNIDISSYPKGNYAVTVENDYESFTGTFKAQTTGIIDMIKKAEKVGDRIYNLQGQRLNSLQKGLNIVNGQKVYVK